MAIVVIGGHSRSVGKTSVVAGLIAAMPAHNWTAFKITQYGHGICSRSGEACDCAAADHSWAISEEKDRSGESDTSRFLVAGATRAWWVRTEQGRLVFSIHPQEYVTPEITQFVKSKLSYFPPMGIGNFENFG